MALTTAGLFFSSLRLTRRAGVSATTRRAGTPVALMLLPVARAGGAELLRSCCILEPDPRVDEGIGDVYQ